MRSTQEEHAVLLKELKEDLFPLKHDLRMRKFIDANIGDYENSENSVYS